MRMKAGYRGTFVISWAQTKLDGFDAGPRRFLAVGATWRWHGDATRVDGPNTILQLDQAQGAEDMRRRAARSVRRLVGTEAPDRPELLDPQDVPLGQNSFLLTDGAKTYAASLIDLGPVEQPLIAFTDEMPPRDRDLWIVSHTMDASTDHDSPNTEAGVICFTPGSRLRTPEGVKRIEDLQEGDLVQTKDNGAQPIEWIGRKRMSGARLLAMPHLRPVRIAADFFGEDRPDQELILSPEHRIMIKGDVARDLFNVPEVLVAAKDLINDTSVTVLRALQQVTYIHLLLDQHQIVWANGVETESFHPASASLAALSEEDRTRLLARYPDMDGDPMAYGGFARRTLTKPEAAILRHVA